jgi:hypothetical protein
MAMDSRENHRAGEEEPGAEREHVSPAADEVPTSELRGTYPDLVPRCGLSRAGLDASAATMSSERLLATTDARSWFEGVKALALSQ